ncbi:MAG: uracil phosphoribosyltransferase [bacterium]|nr:uracil phosphoribosyltransferase [bacterium]
MLEINGEEFPNVEYVQNAQINIAVDRMHPDLNLSTAKFRQQWEIIYKRLLSVYFRSLNGNKDNVGLVIILRAANAGLLAMKERLLRYEMPVFMVWTFRNEISIQAEMLNCNLPREIPRGMPVLILDPMCATATSSIMTIQELKKRGFKDITCIFGVASKDGLKALRDNHPDVKNIVGFTGTNIGLNEKGYVIYLDSGKPVVGDAGDRWMGITSKGNLL